MLLDAISEQRLEYVHPELSKRIRAMAEALPFPVRVTQGLRTWQEQDALFNQKPQVTKARGGWSWHNFGLAVDLVPMTRTGPDWNTEHPVWAQMVHAGEAQGLTAGANFRTFPDRPHFQLTGRFPASPTNEVREIYLAGGITAVWKAAGIEE